MPASLRCRALLLRAVDYGEADRIVTVFTDQLGKLSLVARGARSSRRRFAGALEPFAVLVVELSLGRGDLGRLSAARMETGYLRLLASLERLRAAGRALDALRRLVPEHQPEPDLFDAAVELLGATDALHDDGLAEQLRLAFEVHTLSLLGFWPNLETCGSCGRRPRPEQAVQLNAVLGHLVCRDCGGASLQVGGRSRQLLAALVGPQWHAAASVVWPGAQLSEVARVVEAVVRAHGVGQRPTP